MNFQLGNYSGYLKIKLSSLEPKGQVKMETLSPQQKTLRLRSKHINRTNLCLVGRPLPNLVSDR